MKTEPFRVVGDLDSLACGAPGGSLYVGRSAYVEHYGSHVACIHVLSRAAKGEIRGYESRDGGPWRIGTPNYTGEWPEVDREVERVCGVTIARSEA